jgi:protein-arginine kinase activator protein McsA
MHSINGLIRTMLCENCYQREATCHVHTIIDRALLHKSLCAECFAAYSPGGKEALEGQRDAHCEYCGGLPFSRDADPRALAYGVQKTKYMCLPCSNEHERYFHERMKQDISGLSEKEQLDLLRKLDDDADKHMRQWVAKKRTQ